MSTEDRLVEEIAACRFDPARYAMLAYPWGEGELVGPGRDRPRGWQMEAFEQIRDHLQNPETRYQPCLIARASGHGIGKSAFIGILVDWGMSVCPDCKVVVTANTEPQLRTKTWPEISKWTRLALNSHWFEVTNTSIFAKSKGHERSWRADAITWSATNTEAFAGLHNAGRMVILVMDEASAIDDRVWEVAEGAMTDEGTIIVWVAFGNGTRATGRFRECFRKFRHRWKHDQIDSRTVEGTNKEQINKWIEDCGENSDFVKVRVRGMFPSMSAKQFISETDVDAAFGRNLRPEQYNWAPKILTCDPAWEGDDALVIGLRQGLAFRILRTLPKNDNDVEVGNMLARIEDEEQSDAVFIDGGYGTGIVSVGRTLGREWQLVWFGAASSDPGCLNKRAEIWKSMRDWLKEGGAIPLDNELRDELTGPETVARLDGKLQIEPKDAMKRRGLESPNKADSLALSFAYPVSSKRLLDLPGMRKPNNAGEYDPYAEERLHA